MLVVAEHFFELGVAVDDGGEGHFAGLYTDEGEVLVFAHFDQVVGVALQFLCFLDVFFGLLVALFAFGQSVDIHPDID